MRWAITVEVHVLKLLKVVMAVLVYESQLHVGEAVEGSYGSVGLWKPATCGEAVEGSYGSVGLNSIEYLIYQWLYSKHGQLHLK